MYTLSAVMVAKELSNIMSMVCPTELCSMVLQSLLLAMLELELTLFASKQLILLVLRSKELSLFLFRPSIKAIKIMLSLMELDHLLMDQQGNKQEILQIMGLMVPTVLMELIEQITMAKSHSQEVLHQVVHQLEPVDSLLAVSHQVVSL